MPENEKQATKKATSSSPSSAPTPITATPTPATEKEDTLTVASPRRQGSSRFSTPSGGATTTLDLLNQRLLGLRLKKEEELQRRRTIKPPPPPPPPPADEEVVNDGKEIRKSASKSKSAYFPKKSLGLPSLPLSEATAKKFAIPFQANPKPIDPNTYTKPLKLFKSVGPTPQEPLQASASKDFATNGSIASEKQTISPKPTVQASVNKSTENTAPSGFAEAELKEKQANLQNDGTLQRNLTAPANKRGSITSVSLIEVTPSVNFIPSESKDQIGIVPSDTWCFTTHPIMAIERSPMKAKPRKNESALDLLRTVKDEQPQITIIPADEARVVHIEVEQWKKHRQMFKILFSIAFFMGILIIGLTIMSSLTIYVSNPSVSYSTFGFLMHADVMIISTTFITGLGILIFRMFPDTDKYLLIRIHVVMFTIVYITVIWAYVVGFVWHEKVTGRPEHLYTLHSMVGVMIIGFLVWEVVTGVYIIYRPTSCLVKYHGSVGMITFMLCGGCCVSGYLGRALLFTGPLYTNSTLKTAISNTTAVLIIIFCCFVRYIATEFRFRRRSCPQWDTVFSRTYYPEEDANIDLPGQTLQKYVRMNLRLLKKQN